MSLKLGAISPDTYPTLSVSLGEGDEVEAGDGDDFTEAGDLQAPIVGILRLGSVADHDVEIHFLRHYVLQRDPVTQDNW